MFAVLAIFAERPTVLALVDAPLDAPLLPELLRVLKRDGVHEVPTAIVLVEEGCAVEIAYASEADDADIDYRPFDAFDAFVSEAEDSADEEAGDTNESEDDDAKRRGDRECEDEEEDDGDNSDASADDDCGGNHWQ